MNAPGSYCHFLKLTVQITKGCKSTFLIWMFFSLLDVVRNQCMVEGIHEVFMQAMVDSQEDSTFQELSLEAMSVLSKAGIYCFLRS